MVLRTLGYGAESRWFESPFGQPATGKLSLLPGSKRVPFSNQGKVRQRRGRNGLRLLYVVHKIWWSFNPNGPYSHLTLVCNIASALFIFFS